MLRRKFTSTLAPVVRKKPSCPSKKGKNRPLKPGRLLLSQVIVQEDSFAQHITRPAYLAAEYLDKHGHWIAADFFKATTHTDKFFFGRLHLNQSERPVAYSYDRDQYALETATVTRLNNSHGHIMSVTNKFISFDYLADIIIRRAASITNPKLANTSPANILRPQKSAKQRFGLVFYNIPADLIPEGVYAPEIPELNTGIEYRSFTTKTLDQNEIDSLALIGANYAHYCRLHHFPLIWPVAGAVNEWPDAFLDFFDSRYNPPKRDLFWLNSTYQPETGFLPLQNSSTMVLNPA